MATTAWAIWSSRETAETAIELARENGVAWVGCRMSGHAGAAGVYAALPLKADMIGIYSAVANANHMPLAGGAEPLLGTNPLAIAIPAGEEPPLVLDIATSIVSYGTIKNHKLLNRPLKGDWMIDPKTGEAVIDPQQSGEALLLPMGGYKGAGLALMLGLLAGTLNGALFGRDCVDFNAEPGKVTNTGQFVIALDPARFQPLDQFKAEVDRHMRSLRKSKALPGESVRLPGEERAKRRADRLAQRPRVAARTAGAARQDGERIVDQALGALEAISLQWLLLSAALICSTTVFHFADSAVTKALKFSGVGLEVGTMLSAIMCWRTSGSAIALSTAACSLATIGAGVSGDREQPLPGAADVLGEAEFDHARHVWERFDALAWWSRRSLSACPP